MLAVRLDQKDRELLRATAERERVSMAEIVRQAIRRYAAILFGRKQ